MKPLVVSPCLLKVAVPARITLRPNLKFVPTLQLPTQLSGQLGTLFFWYACSTNYTDCIPKCLLGLWRIKICATTYCVLRARSTQIQVYKFAWQSMWTPGKSAGTTAWLPICESWSCTCWPDEDWTVDSGHVIQSRHLTGKICTRPRSRVGPSRILPADHKCVGTGSLGIGWGVFVALVL